MENAAAETAKSALRKLIEKIDRKDVSRRIKVVVYFDEAHPLTNVPEKSREKTLYDHLCSCLNEFVEFPIFFIFLSTNSSLVKFAAPQAFSRSARIQGGQAAMNAPITETPFDCSEKLMVKPGLFTRLQISKIPYMAQFGRPL